MRDPIPNMADSSHPTRRAILELLQNCEMPAWEIAKLLNVRRPALSHHLAALLEERRLTCRPRGAFRFYWIVPTETLAETVRSAPARTEEVERAHVETSFTSTFRRLA